jgi:hypothetical protein
MMMLLSWEYRHIFNIWCPQGHVSRTACLSQIVSSSRGLREDKRLEWSYRWYWSTSSMTGTAARNLQHVCACFSCFETRKLTVQFGFWNIKNIVLSLTLAIYKLRNQTCKHYNSLILIYMSSVLNCTATLHRFNTMQTNTKLSQPLSCKGWFPW